MICLYKYRGDDFRVEFSRIGELRSILPTNVNVMALTVTATISIRLSVMKLLGMREPTVIQISPEQNNIIYAVVYQMNPWSQHFTQLLKNYCQSEQHMARL